MIVVCSSSSDPAQSVIIAGPDFFGLPAAKGINTKEYDVMILEASDHSVAAHIRIKALVLH